MITMLKSVAGAEPTLSGMLLKAPPYGAETPLRPNGPPNPILEPPLVSSVSESKNR